MADRFNIDAEFEADGVFWEPGTPDQKFSGRLSVSSKHIELSKAAELSAIEPHLLFSPLEDKGTPVLHGRIPSGACTLIRLHALGDSGTHNLVTGESLRSRRFRVSVCILGFHLTDESAPEIASATLSYVGLEGWLRSDAQISLTNDETIIKHPRTQVPLLDFGITSARTLIQLRVASDLEFSPSGTHSAGAEPRISVIPSTSTSLERMVAVAIRLENFFSLWVGTSVRLQTVWLKDSSGTAGWLIGGLPARSPAEEPDIQAWVQTDPSHLAVALAAWLTTPEDFRAVENLVYGAIRNTSMFVETEFLSLAQALESFHRITDSTTIVQESIFQQICSAIINTITTVCENSVLSTRLQEAIRFANEPKFQDRMQSLISRISAGRAEILLGDLAVFEQTLRQTRNFFTHPGIRRQSRVLTGTKELFLFNQKLHALLRLLLLLKFGVSEEVAFEPVWYQSRKWF